MKAHKTYLKGKSVFIVSILVVLLTILIVYVSGIENHRSLISNSYISLSIIGMMLFMFMCYGLYTGKGLIDDFPKFKGFKPGDYIPSSGEVPDFELPTIDTDDGLSGIIISIGLWILITFLFVIVLVVLEAAFWAWIFVFMSMLYWLFFRALKLVFAKSNYTHKHLSKSLFYALGYTMLYLGWIFGIIYLVQLYK